MQDPDSRVRSGVGLEGNREPLVPPPLLDSWKSRVLGVREQVDKD